MTNQLSQSKRSLTSGDGRVSVILEHCKSVYKITLQIFLMVIWFFMQMKYFISIAFMQMKYFISIALLQVSILLVLHLFK